MMVVGTYGEVKRTRHKPQAGEGCDCRAPGGEGHSCTRKPTTVFQDKQGHFTLCTYHANRIGQVSVEL